MRSGGLWHLAAASLLTVPTEVATTSWRRWRQQRPSNRGSRHEELLDPGPRFVIEPTPGIRAIRLPIAESAWEAVLADLAAGAIDIQLERYAAAIGEFGPTVLLATEGEHAAHHVVDGIECPTEVVIASLNVSTSMPVVDGDARVSWDLCLPPQVPRGRDRVRLWKQRSLTFWPYELLGITWFPSLGPPPPCLAVGRVKGDAWIVDLMPSDDRDSIHVALGWDPDAIDLLGCSLTLEHAVEGLRLPEIEVPLSSLPPDGVPSEDLRHRGPRERVFRARLAKGVRHVDFGVSLRTPGGRMLDERPVSTRVESVHLTIAHLDDPHDPGTTSIVGDDDIRSTHAEQDAAIRAAISRHTTASSEMTRWRSSGASSFREYLRWRLSCRNGELLIIDPYIAWDQPKLGGTEAVVEYLGALGRSVRAIGKDPSRDRIQKKRRRPPLPEGVEIRWFPINASSHDRFWICGETALHVGPSVNAFVGPVPNDSDRVFTVAELPGSDAVAARTRFENWWQDAGGRWSAQSACS